MTLMSTHYPDPTRIEPANRHTLAVIVDNEPVFWHGSPACFPGAVTTSKA